MHANLTSTNIPTLINEIIETWRPMIESNGVTLTCFLADNISQEHEIDQRQFHNCVNTLISNAAHYTQNGRVHVHVTADDKGPENIQTLTIIVADTGQGISEEQQASLMEESSPTRLASVMTSLAEIGANISFQSSLGRGSEFTLTYPCKLMEVQNSSVQETAEFIDLIAEENDLVDIQIEQEDIPIHAPQAVEEIIVETSPDTTFNPDDLRGLRVLIVDDVPSNQDVVKLFLNPVGCECFCTEGGEEALELLETQSVDLILMDIRMPGMSGIQTTHAIRNGAPSIKDLPIIALTADGSAETNAACMAAGADLFLTKPVLARDLVESIKFVRRYQDFDGASESHVA